MRAATKPRARRAASRLLLTRQDALEDHDFDGLPALMSPGDVLVVNDAATLPASLSFETERGAVELRFLFTDAQDEVLAIALGRGTMDDRTEDRGPPPALTVGSKLWRGAIELSVLPIAPPSPRRLRLRLLGPRASLIRELYTHGQAIKYAHVTRPLELWDVSTVFAGRPWASELPSAGWALTWDVITRLRKKGVSVVSITHGAGLSSTGDAGLDRELPWRERFEIPPETVRAIEAARAIGGSVIAAGTTVVRALESAARRGPLAAMTGTTDLRVSDQTALRVCDGIITGMHEDGTSHHALLLAFAPLEQIERALTHADRAGYLTHEFGDSMFIRRAA